MIMAARKVVEVDPGYFLIDKDDADAKYELHIPPVCAHDPTSMS